MTGVSLRSVRSVENRDTMTSKSLEGKQVRPVCSSVKTCLFCSVKCHYRSTISHVRSLKPPSPHPTFIVVMNTRAQTIQMCGGEGISDEDDKLPQT